MALSVVYITKLPLKDKPHVRTADFVWNSDSCEPEVTVQSSGRSNSVNTMLNRIRDVINHCRLNEWNPEVKRMWWEIWPEMTAVNTDLSLVIFSKFLKQNKTSLTSLNIPQSASVVCRPSQQLACVPYHQSRSHATSLHVGRADI